MNKDIQNCENADSVVTGLVHEGIVPEGIEYEKKCFWQCDKLMKEHQLMLY